MDFINSPVDPDSLPKAEELSLQPVHPDYKKILLIEWWISTAFLLLLAAMLLVTIDSLRYGFGWLIVLAAAVALSALHMLFIRRSFPFLAFAVREKDVMMQRGWLVRSLKICPFNRIQNCSVQSGPLERKYRLASLIIYTAGSEGADLRIPGLTQEDADRLRYFILGKIHSEIHETV